MTFIYGRAACGMGIYYKIYSAMHIIQPGIVPQYVLNIQFCGQMAFIYGRAACGMGISSDRKAVPGAKKEEKTLYNINIILL